MTSDPPLLKKNSADLAIWKSGQNCIGGGGGTIASLAPLSRVAAPMQISSVALRMIFYFVL